MSTPSPNTQNPYAPPTARVADVTDTSANVELATPAQRLGAAVVDTLTGVVAYLPVLIVAAIHWNANGPFIANFINGGLAISGVVVVILLIITIVLVARYGQTIGKRVLGIRVARPDGSKASLGRIFWLRNVVNTFLGGVVGGVLGGVAGLILGLMHAGSISVLVAGYLFGYLYPLVDALMIFGKSRQCLHDRIANTIVVRA